MADVINVLMDSDPSGGWRHLAVHTRLSAQQQPRRGQQTGGRYQSHINDDVIVLLSYQARAYHRGYIGRIYQHAAAADYY